MDQSDTFEKAIWKVMYPGVDLTVCPIYQPPYSETYQVTKNQFLDKFSEFLAEVLAEHRNLVITGVFNLHVNDSEDQVGEVFTDTMPAPGLDQHVTFPTHRSNNILDLLFTECLGTHRILSCKPWSHLSGHTAVEFLLTVEKEHMVSKHIIIRKLKSIDIPSLIEDLQCDDQLNSDKLDDMVEWLQTKLWTALDKHSPSKEKCITVRSSNLWFKDEVKEQKKGVRMREKIWRQYGLTPNWTALKTEWQKYKQMLKDVKTQIICEKVADCNWDSKKLSYRYQGGQPHARMYRWWAACCWICRLLYGKDLDYSWQPCISSEMQPSQSTRASLNQFTSVSPEDVVCIIQGMPTKSCESDVIPFVPAKGNSTGSGIITSKNV